MKEQVQSLLDREKLWFDYGRMFLTPLALVAVLSVAFKGSVLKEGAGSEKYIYFAELAPLFLFTFFLQLRFYNLTQDILVLVFRRFIKEKHFLIKAVSVVVLVVLSASTAGISLLFSSALHGK